MNICYHFVYIYTPNGSYTLQKTGNGTGTMTGMGTIENSGSLSLCSVYST